MTQILPQLVTQLENLQRNQDALQEQVASQQHVVPPRPSQQPVSTSLQEFAKMMGTPPRVKSQMPFPRPVVKSPLTPKMDSPLTLVDPGASSSGTEQGIDDAGDAVAGWRRSIVGCAVEFLRLFPRIKGVRRQNAVADRAIQQIRSLLFAGGTECIQEVEASSKGSRGHPCSCFNRLFDGHLLGKVRWLRRMSRVGVGPILPCPHLRCGTSVRFGRCEGALGFDDGGGGQATQDSGRWDLAYQLTLLEDPPSQMWAFRSGGSMNPRLRAFAPLCPQKWATIALAYLKEVDYIQSRRSDLKKPPTAAASPAEATMTPSPKRKRNPKGRPREGAEEQQQDK